jgi:hypothetical protein
MLLHLLLRLRARGRGDLGSGAGSGASREQQKQKKRARQGRSVPRARSGTGFRAAFSEERLALAIPGRAPSMPAPFSNPLHND